MSKRASNGRRIRAVGSKLKESKSSKKEIDRILGKASRTLRFFFFSKEMRTKPDRSILRNPQFRKDLALHLESVLPGQKTSSAVIAYLIASRIEDPSDRARFLSEAYAKITGSPVVKVREHLSEKVSRMLRSVKSSGITLLDAAVEEAFDNLDVDREIDIHGLAAMPEILSTRLLRWTGDVDVSSSCQEAASRICDLVLPDPDSPSR
jgi:hypothetical protein